MKKDDYDTPTRLLAGQDFEHVAPEGAELMKNLHYFRNTICQLIADKPGEIVVEENGEKVSKNKLCARYFLRERPRTFN